MTILVDTGGKVKQRKRVYSRYSKQATLLLGELIRASRLEKKIAEKDLSERVGISRATLQKIEKGDLKVEVGLYFETAAILEIPLFNIETNDKLTMDYELKMVAEKLALLPKRARKSIVKVDDDF